jgi:malonate transporter and related proteins
MPLTALAAAWALAFPLAQVKMAVLFAALPTASAVYVFAVRMGGDGKLTAELATASVLLGMVTLPVWVALLF